MPKKGEETTRGTRQPRLEAAPIALLGSPLATRAARKWRRRDGSGDRRRDGGWRRTPLSRASSHRGRHQQPTLWGSGAQMCSCELMTTPSPQPQCHCRLWTANRPRRRGTQRQGFFSTPSLCAQGNDGSLELRRRLADLDPGWLWSDPAFAQPDLRLLAHPTRGGVGVGSFRGSRVVLS
jgi:hypothetical protein